MTEQPCIISLRVPRISLSYPAASRESRRRLLHPAPVCTGHLHAVCSRWGGCGATACGNLNIRARVAACWPLIRTAPDAAAAAQGAEQAGFGPAVGRRCVRLPFENECACLFMCLTPWNRAQFCHQQVTEEAAAAAAGAGCCTQRRLWSGPLC